MLKSRCSTNEPVAVRQRASAPLESLDEQCSISQISILVELRQPTRSVIHGLEPFNRDVWLSSAQTVSSRYGHLSPQRRSGNRLPSSRKRTALASVHIFRRYFAIGRATAERISHYSI